MGPHGEPIQGRSHDEIESMSVEKQRLERRLNPADFLDKDELRVMPSAMTDIDILYYGSKYKESCSWRAKILEKPEEITEEYLRKIAFNEAPVPRAMDVATSIKIARIKGEDQVACDQLLASFMEYSRFPMYTTPVNIISYPIVKSLHAFKDQFAYQLPEALRERYEHHFKQANELITTINSLPPFSTESIRQTLNFYWTFGRLDTEYQMLADERNPYREGLLVAEEKEYLSDWSNLRGKKNRVGKEFFGQLLNPEQVLNEQKKTRISEKAIQVKNMRNLLFHYTPPTRVPIIAKTGILSHAMTDRYLRRYFDSQTNQSSGWGNPYIGLNYIDVFDPSANRENAPYTSVWNEETRKTDIKRNFDPEPLTYHTDPAFKNSSGMRSRYIALIIALRPERTEKLIRLTNARNAGNYVEGRIQPDEIIGIACPSDSLLAELELYANISHQSDKPMTRTELLDLLGSNIEMPIYDSNWNMVWPIFKPSQELSDSIEKPRVQ